jgi:hypothetical protein
MGPLGYRVVRSTGIDLTAQFFGGEKFAVARPQPIWAGRPAQSVWQDAPYFINELAQNGRGVKLAARRAKEFFRRLAARFRALCAIEEA